MTRDEFYAAIDVTPTAIQRTILDDPARVRMVRAGRRTGKTTMLAVEAMWAKTKNSSVVIVSPYPNVSDRLEARLNEFTRRATHIMRGSAGYYSANRHSIEQMQDLHPSVLLIEEVYLLPEGLGHDLIRTFTDTGIPTLMIGTPSIETRFHRTKKGSWLETKVPWIEKEIQRHPEWSIHQMPLTNDMPGFKANGADELRSILDPDIFDAQVNANYPPLRVPA